MFFGIPEKGSTEGDLKELVTFLSTEMNLKNLGIGLVYRLGTPQENNPYPRPLVARFPDIRDRWAVWGKKGTIKHSKDSPAWIQEDLPKRLRENNRLLHRIAKIAQQRPDLYEEVRIKDYNIHVNGQKYGPGQLHCLPEDLTPEQVYSPRSAHAVVFFTKHSPLSNHHVCSFEIQGKTFNCVEQFLALQKASAAGKEDLMQKVMDSEDPAEHKAVLNQLKAFQDETWTTKLDEVIMTAVRAKFEQNEHLANFLVETHPLRIGEASRDTFWGIGFTLESEEALNFKKWPRHGNLLGKTLERVRDEMIQHFLSN